MSTERIAPLLLSATYNLLLNNVIPIGLLNEAFEPKSFMKPGVELPAKVVTFPLVSILRIL